MRNALRLILFRR